PARHVARQDPPGAARVTLESRPDPTPQPAQPPSTGAAANGGGPHIILPSQTGLLPVLPLKNTILFPYLFLPLNVGRPNSVAAVEAALAREDKTLIVVAQRGSSNDNLTPENLYAIGTRAVIKKMNRGDEALEILVQGLDRVRLTAFDQVEPF